MALCVAGMALWPEGIAADAAARRPALKGDEIAGRRDSPAAF